MLDPKSQPLAKLNYRSTIKPAILLVWRTSPRFFVAQLGLTLLKGLMPLANIYINAKLMGILAEAIHSSDPPSELFRRILVLLVLSGATSAFGYFLGRLTDVVQRLYQKRAANYVQGQVVEKTAALDLAFFENPEFHNKMKMAANEAGHRPMLILQQLIQVATSVTTIVSIGIVVVLWHVWLLPIVVFSPLVMFFILARTAAEEVDLAEKRTEKEREAQYVRSVLTEDSMVKEVRLFGLQPFLFDRLYQLWDEIYSGDAALAKRKLFSRGIFGAILSFDGPLLVGFAAEQLILKQINFSQFSLYTQSMFALRQGLSGVAAALAQLHESHLFISNLLQFLELQPVVEARVSGAATGPVPGAPQVEFRHVTFRYPGKDAMALDDVSFTLGVGEIAALVGENGSGKTTIVKLLAGFYEPVAGEILLGGKDIKTMDRRELRRHLNMILQDFMIYHFSVSDNIAIGDIDQRGRHGEIERAAQQTGLDDIVQKLPHGYETVLGRHFKRGHELSGGQRQLVALSRVSLRRAAVLVMDEPTAALDVHNERRFFQQLLVDRKVSQQSVLFICHRLTAVRHAHRILVLHKGKLVEEGAHDQLMFLNGHYASMFNTQHKTLGFGEERGQAERRKVAS